MIEHLAPPPAPPPPKYCARCGARVDPVTATCAECARLATAAHASAPVRTIPDGASLRLPLALYFTLLLISLVGMSVDLPDAQVVVISDLASTVVVLGFAFASGPSLRRTLARAGRPAHYTAAAACVLVTFPVASLMTAALERWLGVAVMRYTPMFTAAGLGFPMLLLSVCVQPAVVEEIAFRGVIQSSLRSILGTGSAVLVSAILFSILHLSIPSFPHLFLLGLALAILRIKTGSLYPGMLLHFLHNLSVILEEGWSME